jgi:D-tyrosyl-tRNA(Tyr) deacylase
MNANAQTRGDITMRAVVQRVLRAAVTVDGETIGVIDNGLLVLLGVGEQDTETDLRYMVNKVTGLRVFPDDKGAMNRSVLQVEGEMLVVSQFTLYGDCRKGRRPSFVKAMEPERAERICNQFISLAKEAGVTRVASGRFGAMMDVELVNSGPVTLLIDSKKVF